MQKHTKINSPLLSQAHQDVVWHWFATFHDSGKQALHFFVEPFRKTLSSFVMAFHCQDFRDKH